MRDIKLLLIALLFFSCSNSQDATHFKGTAMTIDYKIIVGTTLSEPERKDVEKRIQKVFEEVNALYNKWNPDSEISHLNRLKAGEKIHVSPQLLQLLEKCGQIVHLTDGKFDPTIEPLQQLWKSRLSAGMEPSEDEIQAILPAVGWDRVHIEAGYFSKDHDLTSLDLGGIAKGYCVDLMMERLQAAGYRNLFVEWGGEVRAAGCHPRNRPWKIFISRLGDSNPDHAIAHVQLCNQAIATSGDYMQFWQIGDKMYGHIIDPHTHHPLLCTKTSIASSSVLASTCTFADGIAKVGMMFPTVEEATAWAEKIRIHYPETRFWFSTRE